ncbi:MAG: hypothetical protein NTX25_10565 [Proteobacteria bacterium]|nr:hypothetical protein [Pseudomonadota bacterium]
MNCCHCKSDRNLDGIMGRVSLLLAYLEEALRELMRQGLVANEIGMSELEYREVFRSIMAQVDHL